MAIDVIASCLVAMSYDLRQIRVMLEKSAVFGGAHLPKRRSGRKGPEH